VIPLRPVAGVVDEVQDGTRDCAAGRGDRVVVSAKGDGHVQAAVAGVNAA
jgi:hypothetical protein